MKIIKLGFLLGVGISIAFSVMSILAKLTMFALNIILMLVLGSNNA